MAVCDSQCERSNKIHRLRCSVQTYDWGRVGRESQVARLYSLNSSAAIDPDKPYAELWMGTHESGPSYLVAPEENGVSAATGSQPSSLKSFISKNPHVLGDRILKTWGSDLPYLFKVLSVSKALSIQSHPDKELARVLHKSLPTVYKDDNHKPEMTLALTKFESLCGFVSHEELKDVFQNVPEIVELIGTVDTYEVLHVNEQDGERKKDVLRASFAKIMSANKNVISEAVKKLRNRLKMEKMVRQLTDKELLVLQLEKQYPADVGVISAFFLNHIKLNAGEALYLGANEPHAYLSGECVECMATSDNVVRAGLTGKHRDVQTLCSMLTYKQGCPEILYGVPVSSYTKKYVPPFDEFEVDRCILPEGASTVFPAVPGPSIFVVTEGTGTMCPISSSSETVSEGDVIFVPANIEINLASATGLQLCRAGVNSNFF